MEAGGGSNTSGRPSGTQRGTTGTTGSAHTTYLVEHRAAHLQGAGTTGTIRDDPGPAVPPCNVPATNIRTRTWPPPPTGAAAQGTAHLCWLRASMAPPPPHLPLVARMTRTNHSRATACGASGPPCVSSAPGTLILEWPAAFSHGNNVVLQNPSHAQLIILPSRPLRACARVRHHRRPAGKPDQPLAAHLTTEARCLLWTVSHIPSLEWDAP